MPVIFNAPQAAPSGAKQLAQGLAGYNQGQQQAPMIQTQSASPEAIGKLAAALLKLKKQPVKIANPQTLAQGTAMSDAASSTAPPPSSIPDSSGDSGGASMDA